MYDDPEATQAGTGFVSMTTTPIPRRGVFGWGWLVGSSLAGISVGSVGALIISNDQSQAKLALCQQDSTATQTVATQASLIQGKREGRTDVKVALGNGFNGVTLDQAVTQENFNVDIMLALITPLAQLAISTGQSWQEAFISMQHAVDVAQIIEQQQGTSNVQLPLISQVFAILAQNAIHLSISPVQWMQLIKNGQIQAAKAYLISLSAKVIDPVWPESKG